MNQSLNIELVTCMTLPMCLQDRIDYAITIHIYAGGFLPSFDLIRDSKRDGVRQRAADLAACCLRNNPQCQDWAFEAGALEVLAKAHVDAENGEGTRVKVLGALSALVQNHAKAEAEFLERGCMGDLRSDVEGIGNRLKIKALFMLQWLLATSEAARKAALECEMYGVLAASCVDENDEVVEYSAASLIALMRDNKTASSVRVPTFHPGACLMWRRG